MTKTTEPDSSADDENAPPAAASADVSDATLIKQLVGLLVLSNGRPSDIVIVLNYLAQKMHYLVSHFM